VKFRDEFRDGRAAQRYAAQLARAVTRPWTIMEVCGGQTHAIVRFGIDQLLPPGLDLAHGPGCPVCVTPIDYIDKALAIARRPEVVFCSFGDMLRVPGSDGTLLEARAAGADVRTVYSPLDAVRLARAMPGRQVVFFAIGFETTAPANALAVFEAHREGLKNFSMLVCHVLVPPAIESLLQAPDNRVQGFLAAGHVCAVMGYEEYPPIAARYRVPIVVTGFEPLDILQGLLMCVRQLEAGRAEVENQYSRAVQASGNSAARNLITTVFAPVERRWRGLGAIGRSGLALRAPYDAHDAEHRFGAVHDTVEAVGECIAGRILRGDAKPPDCAAFATRCTPEHPLGVTMVSEEGACAAYFRYGRSALPVQTDRVQQKVTR
jgi:hydrogenase expression/formation protein HypD